MVWRREGKPGKWILALFFLGWARKLPAGVGGWRTRVCNMPGLVGTGGG